LPPAPFAGSPPAAETVEKSALALRALRLAALGERAKKFLELLAAGVAGELVNRHVK